MISIFDKSKDRKDYGKRRKCWLPAFSPFPAMFSEGFLLRVIKSLDCVEKENTTQSFNFLSTTQSRPLTTWINKPFENMVGKGEDAGN